MPLFWTHSLSLQLLQHEETQLAVVKVSRILTLLTSKMCLWFLVPVIRTRDSAM